MVLAVAAVTVSVASASSTRNGFADGSWKGTAHLTTTLQGLKLVANSTITIRVRGGRVTGTMISKGTISGTTSGSTVAAAANGRYVFSGPATKPDAKGNLTFTGTVDGKAQ